MQQYKYKLSMWLLYKSKHQKVNGCSLIADRENSLGLATYMTLLLGKIKDNDAVLSLVNRYLNLNFDLQLPEDLPHIPTWILAAQAYVLLSSNNFEQQFSINEVQILQDIIATGDKILDYVQQLAENASLMQQINLCLQTEFNKIQERWSLLQIQCNSHCLLNIDQIYNDLRDVSQKWVAASAHNQQLEIFTPIVADISFLFHKHILQHIPAEFFAAHEYGLGQLQLNFCVDQSVNTFADLHIPYSNNLLPNSARDVLFKVEVYFKYTKAEQKHLLTTSWFAHDLGTAAQRFEDYYNRKFKYKLKHKRYHWISLDGRSNQVEDHGNTATHKLIDHDRLAEVYQQWLINASAINHPVIAARIKHNHKFMQQHSELLASGECTAVQVQQIELLRALLQNELSPIILRQRTAIAAMMQQDSELMTAIAKIDALYSILAVFARLLNKSFVVSKLNDKFSLFANEMQHEQYLGKDLKQHFNNLFVCKTFATNPDKSYLQGEFYGKVQAALAQLRLLQTEFTIYRLGVF